MPSDRPRDIRLTIADAARYFGRRRVFTHVNGEVRGGESLVITGPNGSGKSTLLRIIAGLLPLSAGAVTISLNGESLDIYSRRPYLGYVAPDLALYAELTGVENLLFFAQLRGIRLERSDLAALLEMVGLKGRGRDYVGNYSSGMRQRLKYAVALLHRPLLLLLDEPTANLDTQGTAIVESIISAQKRRGLVVIGTNEVREVGWGDRVVRLGAEDVQALS